MSCIHCAHKSGEDAVSLSSCLCDQFVHPAPLDIGAGLDSLPRQISTFPQFRQAMLRLVRNEVVEITGKDNRKTSIMPLSDWRARDKDDLGIMLLEMWAYICDSLAFYDEVLANEAYLRTSALRPHVRSLVALLGYLPRPAVGSIVQLAAMADGRTELRLPAGTAFRSGAFNGNPPQVFELDNDVLIHPLTNRWSIMAPHPGKIMTSHPGELLVLPQTDIREDALLLLADKADDSHNKGLVVKKVEKYTGAGAQQYTRLIFTSITNLSAGTSLDNLRLMKPTQAAGLWTVNDTEKSINGAMLILDGLKEIRPGELVVVVYNEDRRWFKVTQVTVVNRQAVADSDMVVNGTKFNLPGMTVPVTQLTLDAPINSITRMPVIAILWSNSISAAITVHFGMQVAGIIVDEPKTGLSFSDPLYVSGFVETPVGKKSPKNFLLQDKNALGVGVEGMIDFNTKEITLSQGVTWDPELVLPVEAYGNVISASRGEKVENEKLGSGNASVPNQTFKLRKKPLTYHLSPTAENNSGTKNSLTVYVNGIKWTEVNSFFGKKKNDQVYIVRQNDEEESLLTFGDGVRGERLPTGNNNIIAHYRFGAEAVSPPAGSVNQIAKPVKGLQSVKNILPASGGAGAETAEDLKRYAPRYALLLGRVVSLPDMEALAGGFAGVRDVQAEWRWNKGKQRASAHVFYIGEDGLGVALSQRLRSVSDPSASIAVEKAQAVPLTVSLNVQIDPTYLEADVVRELLQTLMDKRTGLLAPENVGIGKPLYRSKIFETVLKVKGTASVQSILLNGKAFHDFAITPGSGHYFDVEQGKLIINGYIDVEQGKLTLTGYFYVEQGFVEQKSVEQNYFIIS